jgi:hypothetical protein
MRYGLTTCNFDRIIHVIKIKKKKKDKTNEINVFLI